MWLAYPTHNYVLWGGLENILFIMAIKNKLVKVKTASLESTVLLSCRFSIGSGQRQEMQPLKWSGWGRVVSDNSTLLLDATGCGYHNRQQTQCLSEWLNPQRSLVEANWWWCLWDWNKWLFTKMVPDLYNLESFLSGEQRLSHNVREYGILFQFLAFKQSIHLEPLWYCSWNCPSETEPELWLVDEDIQEKTFSSSSAGNSSIGIGSKKEFMDEGYCRVLKTCQSYWIIGSL